MQNFAAIAPCEHEYQYRSAYHQREPTTLEKLEQIRRPKCQVHRKEKPRGKNTQPQRIFPAVADHEESQNRSDHHVGTHGDAVGCRQVTRRLEHHHRQHDQSKQAPVHHRNINLPGVFNAGVHHLQARQEAQLHHLLGHAKCPSDQSL